MDEDGYYDKIVLGIQVTLKSCKQQFTGKSINKFVGEKMIDRNVLTGFEFDWFALDKNNNIALVSTAGYGSIPDAVLGEYLEYKKITESLDTPNWGSKDVWEDYADYGLFVFDWKLYNGPYIKITEPKKEISYTLKSKIVNIKDILKLDIVFYSTNEFKIK